MTGCVACGGEGSRPFLRGLRRCVACGHAWADAWPGSVELAGLYGRTYFHGGEYRDYVADRSALERSFRIRLEVLDRFLDSARHRRLLEIGCAHGFFLALARGRFDSVTGLDVSEEAVRHAREVLGLDAVRGDALEADVGDRRFDVACLWDTIEHLPRPDRVVARIRDLTAPGALLAATTGDIGSLVARLRGRRWRLIHPPTHLHYFTRESLSRLLGRHGFDTVYDRSCGVYRSLGSVIHGVLARWSTDRWALSLPDRLPLGLGRLAFPLDIGDIRYVVARRR